MFKIHKVRLILAVTIGASLYVLLFWIPLIGPVIAGLYTGKIAHSGMRKGLIAGFFSGISGFVFLSLYVFPRWGVFNNFLLTWIILLWNSFGIILTTIGGAFGSILLTRSGGEKERRHEESSHTLIVCPNCGFANPEGQKYCNSCGTHLPFENVK